MGCGSAELVEVFRGMMGGRIRTEPLIIEQPMALKASLQYGGQLDCCARLGRIEVWFSRSELC